MESMEITQKEMKNTVTWSSYPITVIYPDKLTVGLSKRYLYRHAHSKEHYLKQQKQKATVILIRRQKADEMAYWVKKGTRTKADNLSLISWIHKSMAEERTDSQSCPLPFTCMHSWVHTLMKREKNGKKTWYIHKVDNYSALKRRSYYILQHGCTLKVCYIK